MKTLWIVCGPTASGKTALAISLAKRLGAEILSADSRQLFRELSIGVARPEPEELAAVPHHFIANISIQEEYSAGRYAREAGEFLVSYFTKKSNLVLCGGTGLYIRALVEGIDRPAATSDLREKLNRQLDEEGLNSLVTRLEQRDAELAAATDLKNPRRVLRALEWTLSGQKNTAVSAIPEDVRIIKMAPDLPREILYERINRRVDQMLEKGLWEEAESLFPLRHLNALQTVGYQEIFECLEGHCSREEAVNKIKQHSRNYAKRQLTWFRKDSEVNWLRKIALDSWTEEWEISGKFE